VAKARRAEVDRAALPRIRSGKLRALAVAKSKRLDVLPDVPSMEELGYPGFDTTMYYGAYVPAGTPRDIVERLGQEFRAVLRQESVREKFAAIVVDPGELTGERFAAYQTRSSFDGEKSSSRWIFRWSSCRFSVTRFDYDLFVIGAARAAFARAAFLTTSARKWRSPRTTASAALRDPRLHAEDCCLPRTTPKTWRTRAASAGPSKALRFPGPY